jgi:twitching motility protein PilT
MSQAPPPPTQTIQTELAAAAQPAAPPPAKRRIDRFLELMLERSASDLHFSVGRPPMFRLSGEMESVRYRTLTNSDFETMLRPITPPELWRSYEETGDVDFAYQLGEGSRFRVNLFKQERGQAAVLRVIPSKILTAEQLGLPLTVNRLAKLDSGLVLVTGPTGSGKTTTLAAILDLINSTRELHIITIEDPIEFVHPNKQALIHQREVGAHATSFSDALRAAVREDPDIILVGEMRDLETVTMALEAAEKGVLVFGTLHTNNAAKTIDRIVNVFPSGEQEAIRPILGETVRGIVAQQLIARVGGGRVAALEILFGSPQVGNMIREGKVSQITSLIQTGAKTGMISMDQSLAKLAKEETITPEAALEKAIDKAYMRNVLGLEGGDEGSDTPPAANGAPPAKKAPAKPAVAPPAPAAKAARPPAAKSPPKAPPRK